MGTWEALCKVDWPTVGVNLFGTGAGFAITSWASRRFVEHRLARALEAFKAGLTTEAETRREAARRRVDKLHLLSAAVDEVLWSDDEDPYLPDPSAAQTAFHALHRELAVLLSADDARTLLALRTEMSSVTPTNRNDYRLRVEAFVRDMIRNPR